ncbi:TPA: DUF4651 domain-containing protein [Streptococcus pyogenes]|nr:membrane protein [Streptococcus pyogenes]HEP1292147.1 DUF4651 domain-containing protein [Streptococcus pyogenes]
MRDMSKKKIGMISGIFGFSLAIGLGIVIKDYCQDRQRRQMTRDLRTFFSPLGQIEVLYINPCQVKQDYISGGVVMSNSKQYQFTYHSRQISFEEDKG